MRALTYAKAALFNADGKVLLLTRSGTDDKRPGELDFPGGEIEAGEDITRGIVREVAEETGLTLKAPELLLVSAATVAYEKVSITRLFFVAPADTTAVHLSDEHSAYIWQDLKTVLNDFDYHFYTDGLRYAYQHQLLPKTKP